MSAIRLAYALAAPGVGNFGDVLGPLLVAAFSGREVAPAAPASLRRRLASIGTIAQSLALGTVDLWGTGAAGRNNPFAPQRGFPRRFATRLVAHALRGPFSARLLAEAGFATPGPFGDPGWLLPRLWPAPARPPRHELGVILHLSEVAARRPEAGPRPEFLRYQVPPGLAGAVRIISPLHRLDLTAMRAKLDEILDCRRILSTGLHGLILAEAYGRPCAAFDIHAGENGRLAVTTEAPLDHRIRDFYAGIGQKSALVLRQPRHGPTDWEAAIRFLDHEWSPVAFDASDLLAAFPAWYGRLSEGNLPAGVAELQARLRRILPGPSAG